MVEKPVQDFYQSKVHWPELALMSMHNATYVKTQTSKAATHGIALPAVFHSVLLLLKSRRNVKKNWKIFSSLFTIYDELQWHLLLIESFMIWRLKSGVHYNQLFSTM